MVQNVKSFFATPILIISVYDKFSVVEGRDAASQKQPLFSTHRRPALDAGLGFFLINGVEGKPSPVSSTGRRGLKRLIAISFRKFV